MRPLPTPRSRADCWFLLAAEKDNQLVIGREWPLPGFYLAAMVRAPDLAMCRQRLIEQHWPANLIKATGVHDERSGK